jgi:hypothetical protein
VVTEHDFVGISGPVDRCQGLASRPCIWHAGHMRYADIYDVTENLESFFFILI